MSRRVELPTEELVKSTWLALAQSGGRPPTASGLARELGLTNSTFWRYFPAIAQQVADERRHASSELAKEQSASPARSQEAALRSENQNLRDQLALAIAQLQRLAIDNQALREQLESTARVVRIDARD